MEDQTYTIDLSKLEVRTDENMIDENGNPRKDVAIYEGNIAVCHPEIEEKVREAIELFFKSQNKEDQNE